MYAMQSEEKINIEKAYQTVKDDYPIGFIIKVVSAINSKFRNRIIELKTSEPDDNYIPNFISLILTQLYIRLIAAEVFGTKEEIETKFKSLPEENEDKPEDKDDAYIRHVLVLSIDPQQSSRYVTPQLGRTYEPIALIILMDILAYVSLNRIKLGNIGENVAQEIQNKKIEIHLNYEIASMDSQDINNIFQVIQAFYKEAKPKFQKALETSRFFRTANKIGETFLTVMNDYSIDFVIKVVSVINKEFREKIIEFSSENDEAEIKYLSNLLTIVLTQFYIRMLIVKLTETHKDEKIEEALSALLQNKEFQQIDIEHLRNLHKDPQWITTYLTAEEDKNYKPIMLKIKDHIVNYLNSQKKEIGIIGNKIKEIEEKLIGFPLNGKSIVSMVKTDICNYVKIIEDFKSNNWLSKDKLSNQSQPDSKKCSIM